MKAWLQYMCTWFVVTGLKRGNPLILNASGQLQIVSGVSMAYINTPPCLCVRFLALWTIQRSEVHSALRKDSKQAPTKANDLESSFHFFPPFSPLLSPSIPPSIYVLSHSLSLYLYRPLSPSLVMLMIWCAGAGGTCARLTWDDTNRFITMGSPGDQKTHLKGVFQGINCLTWLTQVWETFRVAIKGTSGERKRTVLWSAKRMAEIFQSV